MDISVLASVGSFVVSERILKPKATVLAILGCVLAYDLTTKTHDTSSLRVYRGPALLAFTLIMTAYSLRTWRRNGVACDELLFLPGTPHGARHGIVETTASSAPEGDVAGGGRRVEMSILPTISDSPVRSRTLSKESSLSSVQEFANSWDEGDEEEAAGSEHAEPDHDVLELGGMFERESVDLINRGQSTVNTATEPTGPVQRFRENHPRITRFGSFFFFRSSTSSTQNAAYAPSGPMVVGAALDLSMPILFNFHLYIEAYNHIAASETAAKILPLIFLSVLIVRSMIPPGRRGRFWNTIRFTLMAPFYHSRFRDSFVGDVLTSLVRPLQDVLFALSYYVTVIVGTISGNYGLVESARILETSWLLHNVVLPSCAILPLWWKFLQTLREAYDTGKRWPYLGNAFKYLTASMVVLYGMTHPEDRRSPWWIVSYAACVLYQIWWDVVIDWDLIAIQRRADETIDCENAWFSQTSSYRPNSWLLTFERHCLRPIYRTYRAIAIRVPTWKQIQLRPRRLYKTEAFYWRIFAYNAVFRFTWMLCFIPAYHFSASGTEQFTTFSSDTNSYVGVLLPVAEILRRTLWGFLYLEAQTIKMQDGDSTYYRLDGTDDEICEESELSQESNSSVDSSKIRNLPRWLGGAQQQVRDDPVPPQPSLWNLDSMFDFTPETQHKLFVAELSAWACGFVVMGLWATN